MTTVRFGGGLQRGKTAAQQDHIRNLLRAGQRVARGGSEGVAIELTLAEDGHTIIDKPAKPKPPAQFCVDEYEQMERAMNMQSLTRDLNVRSDP